MAHLSNQIHKALDEWMNTITDEQLEKAVESDKNSSGKASIDFDYGSDDFVLVYTGESDGEPEGCAMIEIRANKKSKIQALKSLATKSNSFPKNQRRFAIVLVAGDVKRFIKGARIKQAILESPLWDMKVVNKVHVKWIYGVRWQPTGNPQMPRLPILPPNLAPGVSPMEFVKIPFEGFAVDGTVLKK